jgi:RNA polymerase sigma-70 factor (ECF subfamily)
MTKPRSLEGLLEAAQNGSSEAAGELLESFRVRLRFLIHLRLGPKLRRRIEVDDVLQETFLRAYKSLAAFRPREEASFLNWLEGIAHNVILDSARWMGAEKRNVDAEVELPAEVTGSAPLPSQLLARKERFDRLETAMNSLAPDYREVILLARLREIPLREVAKRMGRSADAISMLLLRAGRKLREAFGHTDSLHLPPRSLADEDIDLGPTTPPPEAGDRTGDRG